MPQQLFFGSLFLLFLLSFLFNWRAPKPNNTRVCIIGGGISGLTVALFASLKYLWLEATTFRHFSQPGTGYKNVPVELAMPLNKWLALMHLL